MRDGAGDDLEGGVGAGRLPDAAWTGLKNCRFDPENDRNCSRARYPSLHEFGDRHQRHAAILRHESELLSGQLALGLAQGFRDRNPEVGRERRIGLYGVFPSDGHATLQAH